MNKEKDKKTNSIWFVTVKGVKNGPFTFDEVVESLKSNIYKTDNLVWRAGMNDWYRILDVAEFRDTIREIDPDRLKTGVATFLQEKLVCPNCYTRIPITAIMCPACDMLLKKKNKGFKELTQIEPWHLRISLFGGIVMIFSIFLPWVNISSENSITGSSLYSFTLFASLATIIVAFCAQNIIYQKKRNLLVWLFAILALCLLIVFSSDILERKNEINNYYSNSIDTNAVLDSENMEILEIGVYLYAIGVLIVLLSTMLPTLFELIKKPAGSITLFIISLFFFLICIQLLNGQAYKFIISWQLRLRGFEVIDINRIYNEQNKGIDKIAVYEIFVKDMVKQKETSEKHNLSYYFGVKSVKYGTFEGLTEIKLSRIKESDLGLYPETTLSATEDINESN